MVSLFSRGFLKLYFRHEIPPYISYSIVSSYFLCHSHFIIQPPRCVDWLYKNKKLKKITSNEACIAFYSAPCHSLKIPLGIALHCQHCTVIVIEHLTLQSTFCTQRTNIPPFIPPFLRHIIILYVFKLLFTYPNC